MSLLDVPFQMCCPVHRMLGAFFFLSSYSECDPGCYFLRSSYKVPVHFPRTLFPRPPHRECITHCSSVPFKKEKKTYKKYKITKTSKNNYLNQKRFLKDKVSIYPDVSEASSSRVDSICCSCHCCRHRSFGE